MQSMKHFVSLFLCFRFIHTACVSETVNYSFPANFIFGVGTSAYQIEGAWNASGKGESIWDHAVHKYPNVIIDRSNGDVACDAYHKTADDIQLIKNLGVSFYRFSIAWTRIVPSGCKGGKINEEGVAYYSKFIDDLLAEGITPYVTMYHWDLPQTIQHEKGGWLSEDIIEDYVYYARLLFQLYGDRVKYWTTFNEFMQFCERGYSAPLNGLALAPFIYLPGVGGYQCYHNAILAHAHVYRMYEREFKRIQGGYVGVTVDCPWCDPLVPDCKEDLRASEQYLQFHCGWFIHPIYTGDYPPIMRKRIDALSKQQGFKRSRLPTFTTEQIEMIKGSSDFLGLNHYVSALCTFDDNYSQPSFLSDSGVFAKKDPTLRASAASWIQYNPIAFRKLLIWIKEEYRNPPILITESGWANDGVEINDTGRIEYYRGYLLEVLKAIYENKCNVIGYAPWTLMDNFEWVNGYTLKFGLIHVDFESTNKTRHPRNSYRVFQDIIKNTRLP